MSAPFPPDPGSRQTRASISTPAPAKAPVKPSPALLPPNAGDLFERGDRVAEPPPARELSLRGARLRRLLAIGDWSALAGAILITTGLAASSSTTALWALVLSPIWLLSVKVLGLYDNDHRRIRHSTIDELPALTTASALGVASLDGALALSPAGSLGTSATVGLAFTWLLTGFCVRSVIRLMWHRFLGAANGLIIAYPEMAHSIARRATMHPEARLHLVGYLDPSPVPGQPGTGAVSRLGALPDLPSVARQRKIERIVVADGDLALGEADGLIATCKRLGIGLTFLPRHFRLMGPGIELNRLAELPLIDLRFSDPSRSTIFLKRLIDIGVSILFLTLLAPVFLIISILIILDSGAPVFFRQVRIGENGKAFRMMKFRTMVADAEDRLHEVVDLDELAEPMFKLQNDPRVTRVGRFLRRTSLDELPQFLNVLKGTMSLVGPRPEEEVLVAMYDEQQRSRLAVKPGLTGPMQVCGRGDLSFDERLSLERDYVENISIGGDIAILVRTPLAAIRGNGAY